MTKCAAFWKHLNLRSGNRVFPCCRYKTSEATFHGDFDAVINSTRWQELRKLSEQGTPLAGCQKCYHEEKIGKTSLRQRFNQDYDTDSVTIEFLEIGFDNICNLTCDGCGPEFSTAWAMKEDPGTTFKMAVNDTVDIDTVPATITKILFLGGEPLMTNRHQRFLEKITNPQDVSVTYNTNGTFALDRRAQQTLSKFRQVEFIVSVDGIGELNDRVRSGSRWADIEDFVYKSIALGFKTTIHTTVHANNWQGLQEIHTWTKEKNIPWSLNVLTYPPQLDIRNLPSVEKQSMSELIVSLPEDTRIYLQNHLNS